MEKLIKELDLDWSPATLQNIMFGSGTAKWRTEEGMSNRYRRFQDPDLDRILVLLRDQGFNPQNYFFAEMKPGTQLPIHTDLSRSNAVNFPLIGDWKKSVLKFYDASRESLIDTYTYKPGQAVWVNTQVPHTV